MAYGLTFTNSSDVVTLDSEFSRLVVLFSSRYVGSAVFPYPITSVEPPLIFVRPDSNAVFQWIRITGSPGNWTGWVNSSSTSVAGTYFLAAYQARETSTYGMRLWDGSAKLLFDSGTPCAQFTSVVASWSFLGATNTSVGRWSYSWSAASPLITGDYMLINTIAMDLPGGSTYSKLSCSWDYANNRVLALLQNIGDYNGGSFFLPLLFAKPVS